MPAPMMISPGRGRLLESGGDVDRVADCDVLTFADEHETRVDAGPELQRLADLRRHRRHRRAYVGRRSHGPERVVLVHPRHPEHCHHGVAGELLDGPAVVLDDPPQRLEVAVQDPAQDLRIEPLAERH